MNYQTKQIKGKGRGKLLLGYPTINLEIPERFDEPDGIYAGFVWIEKKRYKGAFHYGPIPTFNEDDKSLEVFLIDVKEKGIPFLTNSIIEIQLIEKIRDIIKFNNLKDLSRQIKADVQEVNKKLQ